jgi:hypothetical protein
MEIRTRERRPGMLAALWSRSTGALLVRYPRYTARVGWLDTESQRGPDRRLRLPLAANSGSRIRRPGVISAVGSGISQGSVNPRV